MWVPVDALLLNVDNRRFAAERTLMESKLGHPLDPENSEDDEISVISILLDSGHDVDGNLVKGTPSKDYEGLKTDWLRRKQASPFWIRPDGSVRNGNRRLAMLKRLRNDGITGTEWVEAVVLNPEHPDNIDEHDLFEMEQREQLTEDFKVRYTDMNLLLTLRQAAIGSGIDWFDPDSMKKVAGQLQEVAGGNQAYATIQLRAIKYMDAYLEDANAAGQYHKLLRQVERFRDIGKIMSQIEEDYQDDSADHAAVDVRRCAWREPSWKISALLERCSWRSEAVTKVFKGRWRKTRRNGDRRGHVGLAILTFRPNLKRVNSKMRSVNRKRRFKHQGIHNNRYEGASRTRLTASKLGNSKSWTLWSRF